MDFGVIDLEPDVQDFRREVQQFLDEHLTADVDRRGSAHGSGIP